MTVVLTAIAVLVVGLSQDYTEYVGKTHRFCGDVVAYGHPEEGKRTCAVALYLGRPYWDPGVRIVIPQDVYSQFSSAPQDLFLFQHVCITGLVQREGKFTQIVASNPSQIELMTRKAVRSFGGGAERLCGDGFTQPKLLRNVPPRYTANAMREKVQGLVFLEAIITVEGTIGDVRVVYGLHSELDAEAIKAVKQWLVEPPMKGSNPVAVIAPIEVSFRLK